MEWVERLNQSMHYIEEHLTGEIDYERLARIACCSAYHYQRMFAYMAGVTLAEYIRRRKMSLAAGGHGGGKERGVGPLAEEWYRGPPPANLLFYKSPRPTDRKAKRGPSFAL